MISIQKDFLFLSFLFALLCTSCYSDTTSPDTKVDDTNIKIVQQDSIQTILHFKDSVFESSLDAYVEATILNRSHKKWTIKAEELQQAILAVQVFDLAGKAIPSIPPSLPLSEENNTYITIKPMEAFITTYDLHIFDPLLAKGKYIIKMKNIPSNQVSFEINTTTND